MDATDSPKRKRPQLKSSSFHFKNSRSSLFPEKKSLSAHEDAVESPALKPKFKVTGFENFPSHLFNSLKASPHAHITGKSNYSMKTMNTASTAKTSNMGSSFTESSLSSAEDNKIALAYDRMSDFCNYNDVSSPACDELSERVVGLGELSRSINSFAKNNKLERQSPDMSPSTCTDSPSSHQLISHDDSFISSISATSSPPSFYRDDHEPVHCLLGEEDDDEDKEQEIIHSSDENAAPVGHVVKPRRVTAVRLFQESPPPSPGNCHSQAPVSESTDYSSLAGIKTPISTMGSQQDENSIACGAQPLFTTSTYNNHTRPLIASQTKASKLVDIQPIDTNQDIASTLATNGDTDNVDESIRRLEESSSSGNKGYCSDEELSNVTNGYDMFLLDGDIENPNCSIQCDKDHERNCIVNSPSSECSCTSKSTPSQSRKRADRPQLKDPVLSSNLPEKRYESPLREYEPFSRKQRRHSYSDGSNFRLVMRNGINMTDGPGIFDSPNKKSTNSCIFIDGDTYGDSDDEDRHSNGNDSDCSIVQSFPSLLSSAKTTLPPLPKSPSSGATVQNRTIKKAPHTISHPSRNRMGARKADKASIFKSPMSTAKGRHLSRGDGLFRDTNTDYLGRSPSGCSWPNSSSSPASSQSVLSAEGPGEHEVDDYTLPFAPFEDVQDVDKTMSPERFSSQIGSLKYISHNRQAASLVMGSGNPDESRDRELNTSGTSSNSVSSHRPMPDQCAFENSPNNGKRLLSSPAGKDSNNSSTKPERAKQICPPTPERTALWLHIDENHPDFFDQSGVDTFLAGGHDQKRENMESSPHDEEFDDFNLSRPLSLSQREFSIPYPMRRQNSLVDNKILASSNVARGPRSFGDEESAVQANVTASSEPEHTEILFERDFINMGIIGSGTFAEVFKCKLRNGSHDTFAIKKSRRQFRSKRDRADLLSEVHIMQIVGATECPYLIQFYRAWQENSYFYVQIELAERGTLRDLMNSNSYSKQIIQDKTVVRVLHDVASGLEHIHECGVVHLDIKPQNILISLNGTVKIGDFGIAMAQGTDDDEGHEGDTRYLPKELLNSTDRHYSADIFSLGLTLYEMCLVPDLDVLPYSGELWHDLRLGRGPPLPSSRCEKLVQVVTAAMAPNPSQRPSASDILNCSCMNSIDFSVPCDELLVNEMLPPSPQISRSDSFCPMKSSMSSSDELCSKDSIEKEIRCSTPSMGGAAYRNFVSPPPLAAYFHSVDPEQEQRRTFSIRSNTYSRSPRMAMLSSTRIPPQTQQKQNRNERVGLIEPPFCFNESSANIRGVTSQNNPCANATSPGIFHSSDFETSDIALNSPLISRECRDNRNLTPPPTATKKNIIR